MWSKARSTSPTPMISNGAYLRLIRPSARSAPMPPGSSRYRISMLLPPTCSTIACRCASLAQGYKRGLHYAEAAGCRRGRPRAPSWYLARGDKRYGPLGDRQLLLLAERGGLRTDDLLWKPGFSSWRSVHAVCDLKTLAEDTWQGRFEPKRVAPGRADPRQSNFLPVMNAAGLRKGLKSRMDAM